MAEEGAPSKSRVDGWLEKLSTRITGAISTFVASIIIIFEIGLLVGLYVANRAPHYTPHIVLAPLVAALFAYYDRTIALALFFLIIAVFVIL